MHMMHIRYLTRITYLFPQTCRLGFPQVAARQSAGARTAIRGSPARQCADRLRGNARIIRGSVQSSADKRGSVCTSLKTGIDCRILALRLPLRLYPLVSHFVTCIHDTFSILTFIFEAVTKLAQLRKRLHDTSGFRHFPQESARISCLDSSARCPAENLRGIVRIIQVRPCRYPCPPALKIRGILRKNVSYPCQVP